MPVTTVFLDTFAGTADTLLNAHAPDTAPDGFAYSNSKTGPNTDLKLNGSGHAITVPVGYGTAGVADSSASDPAFVLDLTLPYTVTFIARPSDTLASSAVSVHLGDTVNGSYIDLSMNRNGPGDYSAAADLLNNAVGGGYFWEGADHGSVAAEHTISLYVEETQCTATFDGVPSAPMSLEGTAPTHFDEISYLLDFDHPTDNAYIDTVSLSFVSADIPVISTPIGMPGIRPPAGTPCFLASAHSISPDSVFVDVKMRVGHARKRRVFTAAPRVVEVAWVLEAAEMAAVDAWYKNALLAGEREFAAQVKRQGPGMLWWRARWVEPYAAEALHLGRWRVTGRLLLTGVGQEADPYVPGLAVEFGAALTGTASLTVETMLAVEFGAELLQSQTLAVEFGAALLPYHVVLFAILPPLGDAENQIL